VVADQVLLGQDQPVAERAQERQIPGVAQLERPVHDVGKRGARARCVAIGHERHRARGFELLDCVLARAIGDDRGDADPPGSREPGDDLEDVHVRPDRRSVQDAGVDHR
jgi:hypothetical protein